MSTPRLAHFQGEKYLNVETYKRNGQAVKTPVWFVELQGELGFFTGTGAGKVKRIRHNPKVRAVPCTARGQLKGQWVEGQARMASQAEAIQIEKLLNKKYGFLKKLIDWMRRLQKGTSVYVLIRM